MKVQVSQYFYAHVAKKEIKKETSFCCLIIIYLFYLTFQTLSFRLLCIACTLLPCFFFLIVTVPTVISAGVCTSNSYVIMY